MSVTSLFAVLFLAFPFYSCGAPLDKEILRRTRDVFLNMFTICIEKPALENLIFETRKAYAREHFGDPLESRDVNINGVELLKTYRQMTMQTYVPKAYKQLSIFHAVFEDILQHWSRSRGEKRKIVNNVKAIVSKISELKGLVRIPAVWLFGESVADSLSTTDIPQLSQVWTRSAYQQNKWILGVLGKFEKSMFYLQPGFNKFSKE